ncbi:hypothetical protein NML03_25235 [Klebsiella pneumoniae]|uniref:hypothetical protein n=1 Tax=Klebsiella pneumoniae TaxID=573 RepID=UPI0018C65A6E|nr:hypothetical protein [Klebsiella pneumoniae]HCD1314894.1 hypothetical protein [Klebsiella pneumoniae subsp. pneumoniae]MBG2030732.1 hypothetical protein [Klebsiella pneumoniae]MCI8253846.1 hypothetical protein [Klebsiella pneumoniae]MCP8921892.1 hypothetical protein [Klebsiella pneumoniae]MCP8933387.1 hypothetical protein [Klebsiella pneumoniae]
MGKIIADYQATKDGEVIYSGSLSVVSDENDSSVKSAVMAELLSINRQFGGGVPDTVTVNSWSAE